MLKRVSLIFFASLIVVLLALLVIQVKKQSKKPSTYVTGQRRVPEKGLSPPNGFFSVAVDRSKPIHIGIMGESAHAIDGTSFEADLLKRLFTVLKDEEAQAIFFTGNLAAAENSQGPISEDLFKQDLHTFSQATTEVLGETFPFFPNVGENEALVLRDLRGFQEAFHLENAIILYDQALVYAVSIGPSFFAVISSLNPHSQDASKVRSAVLSWLDNTLEEAKTKHRYLFVIGHAPAFPIAPLFINKPQRTDDELWQVLSKHGVSAYFASQKNLFDRSYHSGIWQIISGGSADGREENQENISFFHSLLLTIMPDDTPPKVEVFNEKRKVVDEFELKPEKGSLIHQLHIGGSCKTQVQSIFGFF